MNIEIARPLFEKLWNEILQKYFEEELGLAYQDAQKPPHSMNQVLGNASWSKNSVFEKQQKRQLPSFVGHATYQKSLEIGDKSIGPETYKFGGSTFRDRYDDLTKTTKTYIGTTDHFMLAMVRTLGFSDLDQYRQTHSFDANSVRSGAVKSGQDNTQWETQIGTLTTENQTLRTHNHHMTQAHNRWRIVAGVAMGAFLCLIGWFLTTSKTTPKGQITRQIADTNSLAKGILGNWYSYNRTYEARGKNDGYVFNRVAWQIKADKNGYLTFERYWKAMEFDGWTEFIDGAAPQLHFFLNVYQKGSNFTNPIGYRHFNCGLWGENRDWLHADTLSCICTTYNFSDSHLGEPLASRELLIRQSNTSFDSLKAGANSLTAGEAGWLERFLPKNDSYIFQKSNTVK